MAQPHLYLSFASSQGQSWHPMSQSYLHPPGKQTHSNPGFVSAPGLYIYTITILLLYFIQKLTNFAVINPMPSGHGKCNQVNQIRTMLELEPTFGHAGHMVPSSN